MVEFRVALADESVRCVADQNVGLYFPNFIMLREYLSRDILAEGFLLNLQKPLCEFTDQDTGSRPRFRSTEGTIVKSS